MASISSSSSSNSSTACLRWNGVGGESPWRFPLTENQRKTVRDSMVPLLGISVSLSLKGEEGDGLTLRLQSQEGRVIHLAAEKGGELFKIQELALETIKDQLTPHEIFEEDETEIVIGQCAFIENSPPSSGEPLPEKRAGSHQVLLHPVKPSLVFDPIIDSLPLIELDATFDLDVLMRQSPLGTYYLRKSMRDSNTVVIGFRGPNPDDVVRQFRIQVKAGEISAPLYSHAVYKYKPGDVEGFKKQFKQYIQDHIDDWSHMKWNGVPAFASTGSTKAVLLEKKPMQKPLTIKELITSLLNSNNASMTTSQDVSDYTLKESTSYPNTAVVVTLFNAKINQDVSFRVFVTENTIRADVIDEAYEYKPGDVEDFKKRFRAYIEYHKKNWAEKDWYASSSSSSSSAASASTTKELITSLLNSNNASMTTSQDVCDYQLRESSTYPNAVVVTFLNAKRNEPVSHRVFVTENTIRAEVIDEAYEYKPGDVEDFKKQFKQYIESHKSTFADWQGALSSK